MAGAGPSIYVLYMQDYGGPVGFRLFTQRPERVKGFVIQNTNAYMEGVGDAPKSVLLPLWEKRTPEPAEKYLSLTRVRRRAGEALKQAGSRILAVSPAATAPPARTTPSTPHLNGGLVSADESTCHFRPARKRSIRTQGVRRRVNAMIAVGPSSISVPSGIISRFSPARAEYRQAGSISEKSGVH